MHPLDGPRDKLKRAKHHVAWLKKDIRRVEADPHGVIEYPNAQTGGYRYEVADPAAPRKWAIVIGDAIHNLHTALDHIVWQLALLNESGVAAAKSAAVEWPPNVAQFPIYKAPKGFKKHGRPKIACLLQPHRKQVKDLQPYERSSVPHEHPLWLLYALSITDKHHVLNTTVVRLAEVPSKPFRTVKVDPDTGETHQFYTNEDGRFEHLHVRVHVGMRKTGYTTVEAKGKFPIEVAFADPGSRFGRDITGHLVVPLMDAAVLEVADIITAFEPAFSS